MRAALRRLPTFVVLFALIASATAIVLSEPTFEPTPIESPDESDTETTDSAVVAIEIALPTNLPSSQPDFIEIEQPQPVFASPLPELEEPQPTPFAPVDGAPNATFAFNISLTHSRPNTTGAVDIAVRNASSQFTATQLTDWKLVKSDLVSSTPTPSPSPSVIVPRNGPPLAVRVDTTDISNTLLNSAGTSQPLQTWHTVYHAQLVEDAVPAYENYVKSGGLARDIRENGGIGFIEAKLLGPATRVSTRAEQNPPTQTGDLNEPPPTQQENTEQKSKRGNNPVIWVLPMLGGIALVVAVVGAAFWVHRRRNYESTPTLPPSGDSYSLSTAAAEQRTTSMGPPPRGTDVLRANAGILSWQENAAAEAENLPPSTLPPPPTSSPPPGGGSNYVRQNQPAPYVPKVSSRGSATSSSAYAPHTATSSSAYHDGTPRTLSSDDGSVESSEIVPDSVESNSFVRGRVDDSPRPSHTFVNFEHDFGGQR